MTDFTIPCETFARLASIVAKDHGPWFNAIRLDNGVAVVTNRRILAAELIRATMPGIIHITATTSLIEQCRKEGMFGSTLTVTYNEVLRFGVAKTTLGYVHPGNCCVVSDEPNDFDKWRSVITQCKTPAIAPRGGMFWDAELIGKLAASSPSGRVVFEEVIDATGRPTIMRDVTDYNWVGLLQPYDPERKFSPATLPGWIYG